MFDAQLGLGLGDLVTVQGLGQCVDTCGEFGDLGAGSGHCTGPFQSFRTELVTHTRRSRDDDHEILGHPAAGLGDCRGNLGRMPAGGTGGTRPQSCLALGGRRATQRIRPTQNSIRAFLSGAHSQSGFDLRRPGLLRGSLHVPTLARRGLDDSLVLLSGV